MLLLLHGLLEVARRKSLYVVYHNIFLIGWAINFYNTLNFFEEAGVFLGSFDPVAEVVRPLLELELGGGSLPSFLGFGDGLLFALLGPHGSLSLFVPLIELVNLFVQHFRFI